MAGLVEVMAGTDESADKAQHMVQQLLEDPDVGRIYRYHNLSAPFAIYPSPFALHRRHCCIWLQIIPL